MPSVVTVPPEAQPSDHFDATAATEAYLAQIPPAAREKSDAYFEGGYWLTLVDFLFSVAMYWALLRFRISARMRDVAERVTRFRVLQTAIYWLQLMIATALIGLPLSWYETYYREHQYGLSTHTLGAWFGDQAKGLGLGIVLGGIVVVVLLAIVRRLPNTWHVWGTLVTVAFMAFGIMIVPVVILPLFNTSKPLADPRITTPIISLARANGIAIDKVYEVDASKQTTRMSANVSGLGGTLRVTLNDNLLKRGSLEEIEAIMGHEMGHYVLNHIPKAILFFLVVISVGFALLRTGLNRSVARWGAGWGLRDSMDVAGAAPRLPAGEHLLLRAHTPSQHAHANCRAGSRHVRAECFAATRWFCAGGHSPRRRVPQDEPRRRWKNGSSSDHPERTKPNLQRHAVEGREPRAVRAEAVSLKESESRAA